MTDPDPDPARFFSGLLDANKISVFQCLLGVELVIPLVRLGQKLQSGLGLTGLGMAWLGWVGLGSARLG